MVRRDDYNRNHSRRGGARRGSKRRSRGQHRGRNQQSGPRLYPGMKFYVLEVLKSNKTIERVQRGEKVSLPAPERFKGLALRSLRLFEVVLRYNQSVEEETIVVHGRTSKIHRIAREISFNDLEAEGEITLQNVIQTYLEKSPQRFLKVINTAQSISIHKHSLELFPGVGKKTMEKILDARRRQEFDSLEDLEERGSMTKQMIYDRVMEEFQEDELKHYLFLTYKAKRQKPSYRRQKQRSEKRNDPFRFQR